MRKIKCCAEIDCETMTTSQFCKAHTQPEINSESQAQIAADQRFEEIKASELKSREWEVRADKLDQMRAQLAELRGQGGRSNDHPKPTFSNHVQGNNYE